MNSTQRRLVGQLIGRLEIAVMKNPTRSIGTVLELTAESIYRTDEAGFRTLVIAYSEICGEQPDAWLYQMHFEKLRPFEPLVAELQLGRFHGGFWDLLQPENGGVARERYDALLDLLTEAVPA